jgi:uncharacterized protein YdhG (YjbR/CyaY superfamily)
MKKPARRASSAKRIATANDNSVAKYFSGLPEPAHTTLQKVRAAILSACPKDATEAITYGIPTFKHNGSICAIAAFKNHCSLFPMSYYVIDKFRPQLAQFEISKGTIRFPTDEPFPATLLKKIVKARLTQMSEKGPAQKQKPKLTR